MLSILRIANADVAYSFRKSVVSKHMTIVEQHRMGSCPRNE
ncbi:MAG: hypothetical protein LZF62_480163 [Nitrospira sp.]|nr:MAG: hypothetical protein LZF62_480163 [Nitrospira sp.]